MRTILFAIVVSACASNERNPHGGGGGNGGGQGGGTPDATVVDASPGTSVSGSLCLTEDLHTPSLCAQSALLTDVDISVGDRQTATESGGTFALTDIPAGNATFVVGAETPGLRATAIPLNVPTEGLNDAQLMAIDAGNWISLLNQTGAFEPDETASVLLYVSVAAAPVVNASIVAPPGTALLPFYDSDGIQQWEAGTQTGSDGVILLFGVPANSGTVAATVIQNPSGLQTTVTGIPVLPNTLTVLAVDI